MVAAGQFVANKAAASAAPTAPIALSGRGKGKRAREGSESPRRPSKLK
jgi:hypothetical protein